MAAVRVDGGPDPQLVGLATEIVPHLIEHDDNGAAEHGLGAEPIDIGRDPAQHRMGTCIQQAPNRPERQAVAVEADGGPLHRVRGASLGIGDGELVTTPLATPPLPTMMVPRLDHHDTFASWAVR